MKISSLKNKEQEPKQITEELKQSEVQENKNIKDSDESLDEKTEIDRFNDRASGIN